MPELSVSLSPKRGLRNIFKSFFKDVDVELALEAQRGAEIITEEFEREGTIDGRWEPLEEQTIKRKGHDIILYDRGELSEGAFFEKRGKQWVFGIRHPRFEPRVHEYGFPQKNIPARPIVGPAARQLKMEGGSR